MQQRLLGYQEQGRRFLSASRDGTWEESLLPPPCTTLHVHVSPVLMCPPVPELVKQLSAFRELLTCLPAALIGNLEGRQGAGLTEEVGVVRRRLEEKLAAGEEEKVRR